MNNLPISEAASKIIIPKRGRPRVFTEGQMELYRFVGSETMTRRHLQNVGYRQRAVALLAEDSQFSWLSGGEAMERGDSRSWKPGLLSELGRIADDDDLRTIAEHLCKTKPQTKAGIVLIRQWRRGVPARENALTLAKQLAGTVNSYLATHRDTPWHEVETALLAVLAGVNEMTELTDQPEPQVTGAPVEQ